MTLLPPPVQSPRIPLWVVAAWPSMKSMRRALRCDGILPVKMNADRSFATVTPSDIREIKAFIDKQRTATTPFDIVIEGVTPGDNPEVMKAQLQPYAEAGMTWWIESMWGSEQHEVFRRIQQGPPCL